MANTNIFIQDNTTYFEGNEKKKFYLQDKKGNWVLMSAGDIKGNLKSEDYVFVKALCKEYVDRELDNTKQFNELHIIECRLKIKLEQQVLDLQRAEDLTTEAIDNDSLVFPRIRIDEVECNTYYVDKKEVAGVVVPYEVLIANFVLKINSRSKDMSTGQSFVSLSLNNGNRNIAIDIEINKLGNLTSADRNLFDVNFIFHGTPSQYKIFVEKMVAEVDVIEYYMVGQCGMHRNPVNDEWVWVSNNGTFNREGQEIEDIKLINRDRHFDSDMIPKNWGQQVDKDVFYQWNTSNIVNSVLGFTIATLYKQRFREVLSEKGFPLMWNVGKSESGKSKTAEIIKNILRRPDVKLSFMDITPFALLSNLSASRNLPSIFDENKATTEHDRKKWTKMVNTVYDSDIVTKGQKDMSVKEYRSDVSVICMGEFTYGDYSTFSRCLLIDSTKTAVRTDNHIKGFNKMMESDYGWVGDTMLWDALNISDEKISEIYNEVKDLLKEVIPTITDRYLHNYAIIGFALTRLGNLCGSKDSIEKSIKMLVEIAENVIKENKEDISIKDGLAGKMLRDIWEMSTISSEGYVYRDHIIENLHYKIKDEIVSLNISSIMPIYQAWCKATGTINGLSTKNVYDQIKHNEYYIGHNVMVNIAGRRQRCLQMQLDFFEECIVSPKMRAATNNILKMSVK